MIQSGETARNFWNRLINILVTVIIELNETNIYNIDQHAQTS